MSYKVSEAAKRLNVNPKTIYRRISDGSLKSFRVGKAVRIADDELDKFINQSSRA